MSEVNGKVNISDLENVVGGVADPFAASDAYLKEQLNLTDQQVQNMTSAGLYSRGFYVDKLNPEQRAEYDRLRDNIMSVAEK